MSGIDGRGSKQQVDIFYLVNELYKGLEVVYEYPIPELNQRIDIFVPALGVAFEIHGKQHYEFVSFFFKSEYDWNKSVLLDKEKLHYLIDKGVKVVEIPYNKKINTVEELKEYVDSIPYPDNPYEYIPSMSETELYYKQKNEQRKKEYNKRRNEFIKTLKNKNKLKTDQ